MDRQFPRSAQPDEERGIPLSPIGTSYTTARTASADSHRMNGNIANFEETDGDGQLPSRDVTPNHALSDTFPLDGYPTLADFIAGDADEEGFVFRRFRWLTARSLLHMQNELIALEEELKGIDRPLDAPSGLARRSWAVFQSDKVRSDLMKRIDQKLIHYRKWLPGFFVLSVSLR